MCISHTSTKKIQSTDRQWQGLGSDSLSASAGFAIQHCRTLLHTLLCTAWPSAIHALSESLVNLGFASQPCRKKNKQGQYRAPVRKYEFAFTQDICAFLFPIIILA